MAQRALREGPDVEHRRPRGVHDGDEGLVAGEGDAGHILWVGVESKTPTSGGEFPTQAAWEDGRLRASEGGRR